MAATVSIDSLQKEYGETVAVDELSLDVESGEVFGFLGPNGAGKSTTIDVMLNYTFPTDGVVTIIGHDAVQESRAIRERVGVLPDGFSLYPRLSGREHVELAIELKGADKEPDAVLDRVGLTGEADRIAGEYSKGMSQRLGLAVALIGSPDLLVFDEPSSGLDPTGIRDLRTIVREEAARGATVFFSSHDLAQVEAVCDRVAILHEGRLVAVDTVDGLRDRLGTTATLRVDARPLPEPSAIAAVDGVRSATVENGRLVVGCADGMAKVWALDAIVESGATIVDFETDTASLEELFTASIGAVGTTGTANEQPNESLRLSEASG